ncbi:type II toxin-antitoxin system PemK/MazF family toxin [Asticcacaulis sp. EMRT-3]|uniref:type II toxin-antitoxin system PemK/MazF family toxin n=1 Tax=Asticcacaulis sp. EMRT-3 TaxID=3040349 RepID=UPI0024AF7C39|nr:type II toxin-antitoxin system PemK/MazF family toxin [Asticcacaulis sp. EMRT-3]MDI7774135.1 type II toxin-antitoxin system PemK/MazF family toxin [Asticcacaulis sp. EMRT-3]
MLNYAYLWAHEAALGQEDGVKDRPAVVVLSVESQNGETVISVCPVTSQTPEDMRTAVQMPPQVKNHLGLTDRPASYIVTTEINRFVWPGPDIRPFERNGRMDIFHGQIPAKLFDIVRNSLIDNIRAHRHAATSRST